MAPLLIANCCNFKLESSIRRTQKSLVLSGLRRIPESQTMKKSKLHSVSKLRTTKSIQVEEDDAKLQKGGNAAVLESTTEETA